MGALDSNLLRNVRAGANRGLPYLVGNFASGPQTLVEAECYGGIVTNEGASGTIVVNLPNAKAGMSVTFVQLAAQIIQVEPASGEIIKFSGAVADDYLALTAAADVQFTLTCVELGEWVVTSYTGTLADQ